jgi:hypothetical protein
MAYERRRICFPAHDAATAPLGIVYCWALEEALV